MPLLNEWCLSSVMKGDTVISLCHMTNLTTEILKILDVGNIAEHSVHIQHPLTELVSWTEHVTCLLRYTRNIIVFLIVFFCKKAFKYWMEINVSFYITPELVKFKQAIYLENMSFVKRLKGGHQWWLQVCQLAWPSYHLTLTYISRTVFSCSSLDFFSSISQSVCWPMSAKSVLVMSRTSCGNTDMV